jgi:hypothetical protein
MHLFFFFHNGTPHFSARYLQMAYKKLAANLAYAAKMSQVGFGSPPKLSTAKTILNTVLPSPTLVSNVIRDHYTKGFKSQTNIPVANIKLM